MIRRRALALLAGAAAVLLAGAAVAERPVADRETGCRVRDQYPDARKTIRWSGPCRNGFAHGDGTLEWAYGGRVDGRATGRFVDGRLDGTAHVEWMDGRSLDGSFRHGRASGEGTFVWPDGKRYTGDWEDDHRTGYGTLVFPEGHRYEGWFVRNRPTGRGAFVSSAGTRYAARVDADGGVAPGPLLSAPQTADAGPPSRLPPGTLEDWLREPPPRTR